MKANIPARLLRYLLLASLAAAPLARADDAEGSTASVKLSAPGKPATFQVDVPWADVRIVGADGDTVTVQSTVAQKSTKSAKPGALRRLDDEVTFELSEKDNVVTLTLGGDNPWSVHDAEFKVSVPRTMALNIKTDAGGDLAVQGVQGDIEINNMNGEVKLDGLVGGAVINTMNGEVRAVYAKAPEKPISITSMNGEVDLRLPADSKANVRLRTHNGSIMTDFAEDVLKTKTESSKGSGYTYSYGTHGSAEAAHAGAEAARAAAEATKAAMAATRDAMREAARAMKDDSDRDDTPSTPQAPRAPRPPRAPRAPIAITGGKLVTGTLNGGGTDIKISTMNGEITLRQVK